MFERILVALDGSDPARRAMERAVELAAKTGASLDVVSVAEELPHYVSKSAESEAFRQAAHDYYRPLQEEALARAGRAGIEAKGTIAYGHTVRVTLDEISAQGADLLVVGSAGHSGVFQRFLGGTTLELVIHAPISVLIVRPGELGRTFKEILVCADGSPSSVAAMTSALDIKRAFGGLLRILVVSSDQKTIASVRAAISARDGAVEVATRHGQPVAAILGYADESDADVLVLGATGRDHERPVKLGATAQRIAALSPRSVLIVR